MPQQHQLQGRPSSLSHVQFDHHDPLLNVHLGFVELEQVPITCVRWRHLLLLRWNDIRSRRHPWPLLEDFDAFLHSVALKFLAIDSLVNWHSALSKTQAT